MVKFQDKRELASGIDEESLNYLVSSSNIILPFPSSFNISSISFFDISGKEYKIDKGSFVHDNNTLFISHVVHQRGIKLLLIRTEFGFNIPIVLSLH